MNKIERDVAYQGDKRLVGGVLTKRDADFGILFERNSHLEIVKKFLSINSENIDQYEDHQVLHYTLPNGAIVAMTEEHGAAFAASAVEKFIRAGVSHVIRIGTCGALDEKIKPWDIAVNYASIIDESTSMKYKDKKRNFVKSLLDELICPIGFLNHIYEKLPKAIRFLLKLVNKNPYEYFTSFSDAIMDEILMKAMKTRLKGSDIKLHRVMNYTGSARYLQNKDILSRIMRDVPIKTIDMETSSILSSSAFHNVSASIINIRIDSPMSDEKDKKTSLKSTLYGISNHNLYNEIIPDRIKLCTEAVLSVFGEISRNENYPLLVNFEKK